MVGNELEISGKVTSPPISPSVFAIPAALMPRGDQNQTIREMGALFRSYKIKRLVRVRKSFLGGNIASNKENSSNCVGGLEKTLPS